MISTVPGISMVPYQSYVTATVTVTVTVPLQLQIQLHSTKSGSHPDRRGLHTQVQHLVAPVAARNSLQTQTGNMLSRPPASSSSSPSGHQRRDAIGVPPACVGVFFQRSAVGSGGAAPPRAVRGHHLARHRPVEASDLPPTHPRARFTYF